MKSVTIKFHFDDEYYQELRELAEKLDLSIGELVLQFFDQGVAFTWEAFQHEAKQKSEDDQQKSTQEPPAQPTQTQLSSSQRVQRWLDWAASHPENSPGLPDEALRRDSIYD